MGRPRFRIVARAAAAGIAIGMALAGSPATAQSDLDAFMKQVMERRDDNWKKLQQYILDEREEIDVRGPGQIPIWGARHDFTWFIQDGYFVRSPVKANGVTIGEDERRKYEANYLRRQQNREKRRRAREQAEAAPQNDPAAADADPVTEPVPTDIEGFIRQTRQPEFISSAYFLEFKFDSGRYALVGREKLEGQDVMRIEYYPSKLFKDDERDRRRAERGRKPNPTDDTVNRLMNKGSRVTLWIEPTSHQIVQYTFDNVTMDFLPAQWLASVTGIHTSMTMAQAFPDVWLPRDLHMQFGVMLAVGELTGQYSLNYHDYRQAKVSAGIRVPGAR